MENMKMKEWVRACVNGGDICLPFTQFQLVEIKKSHTTEELLKLKEQELRKAHSYLTNGDGCDALFHIKRSNGFNLVANSKRMDMRLPLEEA